MRPTAAAVPEEWSGRPTAARILRGVLFVAPICSSLYATTWLVWILPRPNDLQQAAVWWLALATLATGVLALSDTLARRLLPLAALLRLSLVFPERAPSRLRVAMRAGDARRLQQRIDEVRRNGLGDTPARAAEQLLELVGMLDAHDRRTRGHSERVRNYTAMIAREMRLSRTDLNRLQWAALLHDVGKLFVPVELLDKPGRLSEEEYRIVKQHPQWGADLVAPLVPWLGPWSLAVPEHHERWDGGGYPRGLKGRQISLAARIVSVADAYDVMTSTRSYREGMSTVRARRELVRCSGTQFDPDVVRAFLRVSVGRIRPVAAPLTWLAQIPLLTPVAASATTVTPAAVVAGSTVVGATMSAAPAPPAPAPAPLPPPVQSASAGDGGAGGGASAEPAGQPHGAAPLSPTEPAQPVVAADAAVPVDPPPTTAPPPPTVGPAAPTTAPATGTPTTTPETTTTSPPAPTTSAPPDGATTTSATTDVPPPAPTTPPPAPSTTQPAAADRATTTTQRRPATTTTTTTTTTRGSGRTKPSVVASAVPVPAPAPASP